ncbi:MAG: ParB/RepB/Spo0J family partition protein [Defluviitaleaceae bacterium]|nr:ParB/RepB/Spo0J family partition protein [Defluviitaleaceae bacterium]
MLKNISTTSIIPHPNNPRKQLGDLRELSESIKKSGILQNLTVVPHTITEKTPGQHGSVEIETRKGYMVIIGHRRLEAAKMAGLTEVPCTIAEMDEKEQIATMLEENMQRSDLTVYEQAKGFQLMLDLGETISTIKAKTGFSETTIRRRVKLLELDDVKFQQAATRGATLEDYAKLDEISDIELKNKVLGSIGTNNFSWELQNAKNREELAVLREKTIAILDSFATKIDILKGLSLKRIDSIYNTVHYYNRFEPPKDTGKAKYYYSVILNQIDLYVELDEKTIKAETAEEQARQEQEEKKKELYNKRQELLERAYQSRIAFAKTVKKNPKGQDTIERTAAHVLAMEIGRIERGVFADWIGVEEESLPWHVPDEGVWESFFDAKKRVLSLEVLSPIELLFVATYLRLETGATRITDKVYKFLCEMGYEMSDEEKAIVDGTHELFQEV